MAKLSAKYEVLYIIDPAQGEEGIAALVEKFKGIVADHGTLTSVDEWGKRRLAYPIKGQRKGAYWLFYFRGPSSMLTSLNRQWEIHDGILRHLVLKIHPHIVDAVLEHAKAGPAPAAAPPPAAPTGPGREIAIEVPEFEA